MKGTYVADIGPDGTRLKLNKIYLNCWSQGSSTTVSISMTALGIFLHVVLTFFALLYPFLDASAMFVCCWCIFWKAKHETPAGYIDPLDEK